MKLHRGPLKSHPLERDMDRKPTLHEIVRTDPATYYSKETLTAEDKPSEEQETAAMLRCRDTILATMEKCGDLPDSRTARAWMVRHPDKKGLWFVHVMVMGTKKWADVQEKAS